MFIRFTTTEIDEDSHQPKGIFIAAAELLDSGTLPAPLHEHLEDTKRWFHDNLAAPDHDAVHPRTIFWFKTSAHELIGRVWDLVNILRAYGYHVEEVTCERPGKITYEDEHQVAAIPFRDIGFRR